MGGFNYPSISSRVRAILSIGLLGIWSHSAWSLSVQLSESPTNTLALTLSAIKSARHYLYINIYELTSGEVAEAICEQVKSGVHVEILEEGQPVGGFPKLGVEVENRILSAMSEVISDIPNRFFLMTSKAWNRRRRFHLDHAKYIVVDGSSLLIGSENYSLDGNPEPGRRGTRGWETWVHDKDLATRFASTFEDDVSLQFGDVLEVTGADELRTFSSLPKWVGWSAIKPPLDLGGEPQNLSTHANLFDAESIQRITSPDTSRDGLLQLIGSAKESLDLELLSFSPKWGRTGNVSPLLKAVEDAARRGVSVRVLLNDESVFPRSSGSHPDSCSASARCATSYEQKKYRNQITADLLNKLGEEEDLDLTARIADLSAMQVAHIHNKGALVDDNKTLISSINWTQNSVENNREAAVVLTGKKIYEHYKKLFEDDWNESEE